MSTERDAICSPRGVKSQHPSTGNDYLCKTGVRGEHRSRPALNLRIGTILTSSRAAYFPVLVFFARSAGRLSPSPQMPRCPADRNPKGATRCLGFRFCENAEPASHRFQQRVVSFIDESASDIQVAVANSQTATDDPFCSVTKTWELRV